MRLAEIVTCFVPRRKKPGFGCPECGAPLPSSRYELAKAALVCTPCCGYRLSDREALRWAAAGQAMRERS